MAQSRNIGLRRAVRIAAAALVAASLADGAYAHDPSGSTTGRSCDAWWEFEPTFQGGAKVQFSFAAHAHAPLWHHNDAREDAATYAWACADAHWQSQLRAPPPAACLPYGSGAGAYGVIGYPRNDNLHAVARWRLCQANPDREFIRTDIYFHLAGNEGCLTYHPWSTHLWVSGYEFACPRDRHTDEPTDVPENRGSARYQLLPNARLPGNDLDRIELEAADWTLCRRACTVDTRCDAWTYRAPTATSGPLCLIKSRAGVPVPDTCCRSGIKQ